MRIRIFQDPVTCIRMLIKNGHRKNSQATLKIMMPEICALIPVCFLPFEVFYGDC